jgi:uncharacterized protein
MNVLLSGVVGSTAYGLAREGSDVDRIGVFAAETVELLGLSQPKESHVTFKPDSTFHEARKYCKLALGCNPTAMELMWLPCDLVEVRHPFGDELVALQYAFLSARRVRNAYLGYATGQFRKLESRGDGSFSADTRKRTAKHARHLMRMCWQGERLHTTGILPIRVDNPQRFHDFGDQVADGDLEAARNMLASTEAMFDANTSPLPTEPDETAVQDWLIRVRKAYL